MNRDNIIGLLLIFVILIGFSILNTPSKEEREQMQYRQDSIASAREAEQELIRQAEAANLTTETAATPAEININPNDSSAIASLNDQLGHFATAALGEQKTLTVKTEKLKLTFSNQGGKIESVELVEFKTWDQEPLVLFAGDENLFNLQFYSANRLISTEQLYFEPVIHNQPDNSDTLISLAAGDSITLGMRLYSSAHTESQPQYLEWQYVIKGDDYMLGMALNTVGMQDIIASNTTVLNLTWQKDLPSLEKSRKNEMITSTVYFKYINDEVDNIRETKDESKNLPTNISWISFKQQFFSNTLIAKEGFSGAEVATQSYEETNEEMLKRMVATIDIPYNSRENNTVEMGFYFGPNHFNTLKQYDMNLEQQIPLGWALFRWINQFIVIPVFNYLDSFHLNYGIIILILTLLLKTILFPIAYKTYLSSARMRVLKPEIAELNAKYPKKEDAMKKQQAVMALYKKAGVNPMAGCVPMLLQFPILIAMFRFFPASFELRQQGFLWANDLSSYDSIFTLPFTIPYYGDHVSLFTLLMTASTIIYTRMNSQMMDTGTQMPGMKTMLYLMPVMLLFVFNSYASGLSYYYFLTNVITFAQMYAFQLLIDEDKIRRRIEENKKKPVKKSGWQKRLEDLTKQQQQVAQQKRKK